nr:immunoglobulin heavy chain junction region [Macaca mulatta]MOW93833.1 immunoglobulin heavy chain junction region [Macaca mulatta]MOW94228.1 immunoglobulin heavy chain junction region [Macaca mulatta]MOW94527.1 immunoglobulin heavy chain junction region [Macaca mulatta]MOW94700.1 immunoglobulin heavy chain junction region [Macaca mulatta]
CSTDRDCSGGVCYADFDHYGLDSW